MAGKALVAATGAICILASGCAVVSNAPAPAVAAPKLPAPPAPAAPKPLRGQPGVKIAPLPLSRPSAPSPAPNAKPSNLPAAIKGETSWADGGKTLLVKERGSASTGPVPIFRQAIVLAKVRAVLAGAPAVPSAEFKHGMLTLTFPRGNSAEIADAVNHALSAPEVSQLSVKLPQ